MPAAYTVALLDTATADITVDALVVAPAFPFDIDADVLGTTLLRFITGRITNEVFATGSLHAFVHTTLHC